MDSSQDIERLEKERPRITDPEEFAIIREIYFDNDMIAMSREMDIDLQEKFDRSERRRRNGRISSR